MSSVVHEEDNPAPSCRNEKYENMNRDEGYAVFLEREKEWA